MSEQRSKQTEHTEHHPVQTHSFKHSSNSVTYPDYCTVRNDINATLKGH